MIGTIESFDLYVQNFYLFALSRIMYADPPIVYDHPDGVSYLLKDKIDEVTNDILAFEPETSRRKFLAGIQKHIRFFNDGNTDQEGIDLDKLLHWYIEVFLDSRARNTQIITKNFYKYYQDNTGEGVFSFDEVYGMVKELIDTESPVPGYSYPQELTVCRAFLYALTSGKNSFSISSTDFLNGVARFGVDCPFPFINVAKSSMVLQSMQSLLFPEASSPQRTKSGGGLKKKSSNKNPLTQLPFMKGSDPLAVKSKELSDGADSSFTMKPVPLEKDVSSQDKKRDRPVVAGVNKPIESASMLFAQHFGILRELKHHVYQLKDQVRTETDSDRLRKTLEEIIHVLEAGCQFLTFPITY